MKLKNLFLSIFIVGIVIILPKNIFGQYFNLSITPPILETIIKPGKSILVAYTIKNNGDPIVLYPSVVSFEPKGNNGNIKLKNGLEGPVRFKLDNSKLKLDKPFFIGNNKSSQLLLRIRVPDNAPEGDYYYSFILKSSPSPPKEGKSTTATKVTIGSNILITVTKSGRIDLKGKIVLFETIPHYKIKILGKNINIFDSFDKIPTVLLIENLGKNLIKPYGKISLKGSFGLHSEYDLIPNNILSHSQRIIKTKQQIEYCNKHTCLNKSSLTLSGFFIGKYVLSSKVSFGQNSPVLYKKISFIAMPVKILAVILLISVILVILLARRRG